MQRVKMSKKKNEQTDLKWKHSTEAVEKGKVSYVCRFLGSTPVSHSKGSELIKESIKKLQFANDIKKSEEGLKASKLKKVEFCVSVNNLVLTDTKTKTTLYSFPLQRISYCADDKASKKLFGFIAREKEKPQHYCYVLEYERNAEELTLAVGQAFDLAYKKFKASQAGSGKKEVDQMKQRVQSTEKENEILKKKLEELEKGQQPGQTIAVTAVADEQPSKPIFEHAETTPAQPSFDPFSFDSNDAFSDNSISSPPVAQTEETTPAVANSNPFAVYQEEPPSSNQNDLFNMFSAPETQPTPSVGEDPFDPLSNNMARAQEAAQPPLANSSSFDQVQISQQQNEPPTTSLSRPKPTALTAGLLPPPPTKQSMKAAQKQKTLHTPDNTKPADPFAELGGINDSGILQNSHQGVNQVQEGQNNLVSF